MSGPRALRSIAKIVDLLLGRYSSDSLGITTLCPKRRSPSTVSLPHPPTIQSVKPPKTIAKSVTTQALTFELWPISAIVLRNEFRSHDSGLPTTPAAVVPGQRALFWPLYTNYFGRSGSGVIVVWNCRSCASIRSFTRRSATAMIGKTALAYRGRVIRFCNDGGVKIFDDCI